MADWKIFHPRVSPSWRKGQPGRPAPLPRVGAELVHDFMVNDTNEEDWDVAWLMRLRDQIVWTGDSTLSVGTCR